MSDFLTMAYPWIKSLHVISVVAWMAGMFYLPRLFVYHAEPVETGSETDRLFQTMERRLLQGDHQSGDDRDLAVRAAAGLHPRRGRLDEIWPWTKAAAVLAMTWVYHWLAAARRKDFRARAPTRVSGRTYRMMNEVPTLALIVIVLSVIGVQIPRLVDFEAIDRGRAKAHITAPGARPGTPSATSDSATGRIAAEGSFHVAR